MMAVDLLLNRVPPAVGALVVQAAQAHVRGPWASEDGVDVVGVWLPEGAWVEIDLPYLGRLGLGVEQGAPAMRVPAAVAWLLRGRVPIRTQRPDGGAAVLVLELEPGRAAWLDVPGGGRVGLRLAPDAQVVSAGSGAGGVR